MFDHSFRQLPGPVWLLPSAQRKSEPRASPQRSNQSGANVEAMMFQSGDLFGAPQMDCEGAAALFVE
jgi:hypothetical protein